jgi:hypothetical protein
MFKMTRSRLLSGPIVMCLLNTGGSLSLRSKIAEDREIRSPQLPAQD